VIVIFAVMVGGQLGFFGALLAPLLQRSSGARALR
jgi:hypothetical protein